MEHFREFGVMTHAVAVAADVDDVTVVQQPVDECRGHDLVAQDLAPPEPVNPDETRGGNN